MKYIINTVRTYHAFCEYIVEASDETEAIDKWNFYDIKDEFVGSIDYDDEEFQEWLVMPDNRSYEAQVNDFVSKVIDGVEV